MWPLPALAVWALAWALFWGLLTAQAPVGLTLLLATGVGVAGSVWGRTRWRRWIIALGFPLSLALSSLASWPGWVWLAALLVLTLVYPLRAWRDAPLFPTPISALKELPSCIDIASGALVLDAGCGLGDGLKALRRAFPQACLHGLELSWLLCALCALRCPWASVRQGDIWQADWSGYDLIYLFQRPESMARAAAKANAELRPGAWLVSLEFEASALQPDAVLHTAAGKPVWLYRQP